MSDLLKLAEKHGMLVRAWDCNQILRVSFTLNELEAFAAALASQAAEPASETAAGAVTDQESGEAIRIKIRSNFALEWNGRIPDGEYILSVATPPAATQVPSFTDAEINENPRLKFEPENWVRRDDGKVVRVDRWEWGIRAIVSTLWGNRHEFEISEVVEAVEALAAPPAGISPAPLQPTTETVPVGEIVALRRNDARYRWLRTMWCQTILEDLLDKMPGRHPQKELDAAIDAAGAALSQGDVSGEGEGASPVAWRCRSWGSGPWAYFDVDDKPDSVPAEMLEPLYLARAAIAQRDARAEGEGS